VGERFTAYQRSAQAVQSDRDKIFAARAAVVSAANSRVQVEGYGVTVKELVTAVPSGFLIVIGPLVAEGGTVAVIRVEESMVNFVARTPLKVTLEVPARNRPLNTTAVLTGPLAGENCVSPISANTEPCLRGVAEITGADIEGENNAELSRRRELKGSAA
jgi:DNA mismatch repair protein MutH